MLSDFGIILLFIAGAAVFTLVPFTISKLLRPNRPNEQKLSTYECGEEAVGNAWGQFNVRFYIIALMFLLFEIEVVFLFPWATVFGNKELIEGTNGKWGWISLTEALIFVCVLVLGLAYAWKKGYLEWEKPEPEIEHYTSPVPKALYEEVNKKYVTINKQEKSGVTG